MSPTEGEFPFEVENTLVLRAHAYVFARSLGSKLGFRIVEGSTLGGHALEPYLDIPRSLDKDGKQRFDLFAFVLKRTEELRHFTEGKRVVLRAECETPRSTVSE